METFLREFRSVALQPPATAPLGDPVAFTSAPLQPLAMAPREALAVLTSAASQPPDPAVHAARTVSKSAFSTQPVVTSAFNPAVIQPPAPGPCLPWVEVARGGKRASSKLSPSIIPDAHVDLRISKLQYHIPPSHAQTTSTHQPVGSSPASTFQYEHLLLTGGPEPRYQQSPHRTVSHTVTYGTNFNPPSS